MVSEGDFGAAHGGLIVKGGGTGELGGGVVADEIIIAVQDVAEHGAVQKAIDRDAKSAGQDERDPHRRIVTSAQLIRGRRHDGWIG